VSSTQAAAGIRLIAALAVRLLAGDRGEPLARRRERETASRFGSPAAAATPSSGRGQPVQSSAARSRHHRIADPGSSARMGAFGFRSCGRSRATEQATLGESFQQQVVAVVLGPHGTVATRAAMTVPEEPDRRNGQCGGLGRRHGHGCCAGRSTLRPVSVGCGCGGGRNQREP